MRAVSISSYLPGRIRLHSKKLIGNAELGRKVYAYIASYKEIDEVDINVLTGSVLIIYRPQVCADQQGTRPRRELYYEPC